ncbi:MAG: DUF5606 domain-containing protein [Bacteroidales bacterium]|nr:DUF5606 domain-containing protein [Bacteroidales bacterium]
MKDLTEILAISGKGGLFKMVAQAKNSIIVESLNDGKRMPVHATEAVSSLEEISIFTDGEDMPLKDVFKRIYEKTEGGKAPSHKDPADQLKAFMEEVVPDYDKDQVYISDIKKVMKWYNNLHDADMLSFVTAEEEKEDEPNEENKDEKKDDKAGEQEEK